VGKGFGYASLVATPIKSLMAPAVAYIGVELGLCPTRAKKFDVCEILGEQKVTLKKHSQFSEKHCGKLLYACSYKNKDFFIFSNIII